MSVIELLNADEKHYFDQYRKMYAGLSDVDGAAPIEKILEHWAKGKDIFLNKIFTDSLIYEKEFEYNRPADEIRTQFDTQFNVYTNSPLNLFKNCFLRAVKEYFSDHSIFIDGLYYIRPAYWAIKSLLSLDTLTNNKANIDVTFECGDKTIHIQPDSKPVKIIGKVVNAMGFDSKLFEDFRIEHSKIFNQKKVKGTLCVSIHPLDYATMSDNSYNWSSCMSWINEGEFRRGTVEMMTSDCAIVAYIKGEDTRFGSFVWNSKKWRTLVLATPDLVTNVKGYPYCNEELSVAAVNFIIELINEKLGLDFKEKVVKIGGSVEDFDVDDISYQVEFTTDGMYNDFGSCISYARIGIDCPHSLYIDYSGPAICMQCGRIGDFDEENVSPLVCEACDGYHCDIGVCDCCNHVIYEHDDYYTTANGELCCYDCYEDGSIYRDCVTGEFYLRDDLYRIKINKPNNEGYYLLYSSYCSNTFAPSQEWEQVFGQITDLKPYEDEDEDVFVFELGKDINPPQWMLNACDYGDYHIA